MNAYLLFTHSQLTNLHMHIIEMEMEQFELFLKASSIPAYLRQVLAVCVSMRFSWLPCAFPRLLKLSGCRSRTAGVAPAIQPHAA